METNKQSLATLHKYNIIPHLNTLPITHAPRLQNVDSLALVQNDSKFSKVKITAANKRRAHMCVSKHSNAKHNHKNHIRVQNINL